MRRQDEIPKEGPRLAVIRVKQQDGEVTLWVVGRFIRGFVSHWNGSLTVPCDKNQEGDWCERCDKEMPTRWRGYLDVIAERTRQRGFLELTATGSEELLLTVNGSENLRGARIKAFRGRGDKTRLRFAFLAPSSAAQLAMAPDELDPHDTVMQLYCSKLKAIPRGGVLHPPGRNGFAGKEGGQE